MTINHSSVWEGRWKNLAVRIGREDTYKDYRVKACPLQKIGKTEDERGWTRDDNQRRLRAWPLP